MNDRRDQQLHFRVSKQELERIRKKMESSGILSIGSYLRKMALDGYCLHLDLQELRRMAYLLQPVRWIAIRRKCFCLRSRASTNNLVRRFLW